MQSQQKNVLLPVNNVPRAVIEVPGSSNHNENYLNHIKSFKETRTANNHSN